MPSHLFPQCVEFLSLLHARFPGEELVALPPLFLQTQVYKEFVRVRVSGY